MDFYVLFYEFAEDFYRNQPVVMPCEINHLSKKMSEMRTTYRKIRSTETG